MSTTDTEVSNLIVNKLTLSKYKELKTAGTLSETESYEITDIDTAIETGSADAANKSLSNLNSTGQAVLDAKADDNAIVHKAGNETITGYKTIENNISLKDIQGTIGTTTNQWAKRIQFTDSTGARIARLEPLYVDTTTLQMGIYASNGLESEAGICVRSDGTTYAPTPSIDDNSTKIATTAYVKAQDYASNSIVATNSTELRTLADRFADILNVKDFGAKGDGITDDTAAFNAAGATGKHIYVPYGKYKITQDINGNFCTKDKVLVCGGKIDVDRFNSDVKQNLRKDVVAELPYKFPDFNTTLTTLSATNTSIQGFCYDKQGNIYILYEYIDASYNPLGVTIVKYDATQTYNGYIYLPYSNASIIVLDKNNSKKLYARYRGNQYINNGLYEYDITNVNWNGESLTGTLVIKNVGDEYCYSNGFFYLYDGFPRINNLEAKDVIKVYNENFERVGNIYLSRSLTGFDGTNKPYYNYIPKTQGFCVMGKSLFIDYGNGWIPQNQSTPTEYEKEIVHDIGCAEVSIDGKTCVRYGVASAWEFVNTLRGLGYTVTKLESEGCVVHPSGEIHAIYMTAEQNHMNTDKRGILIIREFSQTGFDCTPSKYFPIDIERLSIYPYPYTRSENDVTVYYDPYKLTTIDSIEGFLNLMSSIGIPSLRVYAGNLNITKLGDIQYANDNLIEFRNASNNIIYITVYGQPTQQFIAYTSENQWVCKSRNLRTENYFLDGKTYDIGIGEIGGQGSTRPTSLLKLNGIGSDGNRYLCIGGGRSGYNAVKEQWFYTSSTADTEIGTRTIIIIPGKIAPGSDNSVDIGSGSLRFKQIYAVNATINTSDERLKQDIDDIDERVFKAWAKVDFKQFRFKDSVNAKGENARIHFGVIAQRVKEAFESESLDGFKYGLLCYDEWEDEYEDNEIVDKPAEYDEDGNETVPAKTHVEKKLIRAAGNAYGIRYSEALALECAYQRWKLEQLEKKLK